MKLCLSIRWFLFQVFLFSLAALSTACGTLSRGQSRQWLYHVRWYLEEAHGYEGEIPTGDNRPYLYFQEQDRRLNGFSGCNDLFASFAVSDDRINFGPIGQSRKACPDRQAAEAALINALSLVNRYALLDGTLVLLQDKKPLLRLRAG